MAGFDATTAVEALDFNFRPHVDVSGTIPEPSDAQINRFFKDLQALVKQATGSAGAITPTPDQTIAWLSALSADQMQESSRATAAAVDRLCSGTPSAEQILALPFRLQQAFIGWLMGMMRPEAGNAATTP